MAEKGKARPAARPAAAKPETKAETTTATKAAAAFQRFKAARAEALGNAAPETGPAASTETPAWPFPPSFSLPPMPQMPPMPQGWAGMLPQPGMVQPAPLAVGPLGDRLGSTLRLGIDVINMALAGSLRMLGGGGWGGHAQCNGGFHGYHGGCCDPCGGHDCCEVFQHEGCCSPSVGTCCD